MKIAHCPYALHPPKLSKRPPRQGALLKVAFTPTKVGYADCHPWPEFGALPLKEQLGFLAQGKTTNLTERSLTFAKLDAEARAERRHLFENLLIPESHILCADPRACLDATEGKLYKVKVGSDLSEELKVLLQWKEQRSGKLILDFNSRLSRSQFLLFLRHTEEILDRIEFYEDPFPYHPTQWQQVREDFGITLACDEASCEGLKYPGSCDILVLKPAIQEIEPFLAPGETRGLVITSCLDHPIGQLSAAYVAATLSYLNKSRLISCGLLSHMAYTATPFSQRLKWQSTRLLPVTKGYGWGYDDLLNELPWQIL